MYQTLVEAILDYAEKTPDQYAVCFRNEHMTYKELKEKMERAAIVLKQYGVKRGDRVLLTAVSKPEYVIGLCAIQYIGGVSVPVDKNARKESILAIADIVEPCLFLTDTQTMADQVKTLSLKKLSVQIEPESVADSFSEKKPEELFYLLHREQAEPLRYQLPDENDMLELLFTTGTTGKPKGAILTRKCILANIKNTWQGIGMKKEDVVLIPLPFHHSFGMRVLRSALYIGATVVLQNGFAFAKEMERNIHQFACTGLVSVPASMEVILGQMQDRAAEILGKLRYIEISAGSLSHKLKKKLPKMLPHTEIHNTWGSTESGGAVFLNLSQYPEKSTSIGKPLEPIELNVLDSENNRMEYTDAEHVGKMALKGEMQMAGYYKMPEQTKEAIQNGWLVTNDLVYTDADGYVYMLGRADDIINVGGEKVSPVEVENIASEYEGIRECACIGVKDREGILGQIPILYLVPTASYQEEACVRFFSEHMEKYKIPQKFLIIDKLPRNQMEKPDRKALYQRWEKAGETELCNPVVRNLLSRRSIRRFKNQEIPEEILSMIVKAGIYAPSGHNLQTWRFTVIKNNQKILQLKEQIQNRAKEKKVHFYGFENPKYLILVSNDRRNPDGIQDASCAAQNIMLAAHSYGIGSVWLNPLMTICDEPEIRELLNTYSVPSEHIVWAMIALGYPAEEGNLLAKKMDVVQMIE